MARNPRIEFEGALYHVYSRGNQKQDVFFDDNDYKLFIKRLCEYKKEYDFILYAYILMKNHVHMLIQTRETGLSKIMQGVLQSYTQYFNLKYKKVGHVFQGRYKAILCQQDLYLMALIRYIHLNCVRAHFVEHPSKYKWCSHNDYLNGLSEITDVDMGLKFLSSDKGTAIKKYKTFIDDGMGLKIDSGPFIITGQQVLGDEIFVKKISDKYSYLEDESKPIVQCGLPQVWEALMEIMNVTEEDVLSRSRDKQILSGRAVFVYLCKRFCGMKSLDIAELLKRDPKMVTNLDRLAISEFDKEIKKVTRCLNSKLHPDPK